LETERGPKWAGVDPTATLGGGGAQSSTTSGGKGVKTKLETDMQGYRKAESREVKWVGGGLCVRADKDGRIAPQDSSLRG